jgi:hypothetical protein
MTTANAKATAFLASIAVIGFLPMGLDNATVPAVAITPPPPP